MANLSSFAAVHDDNIVDSSFPKCLHYIVHSPDPTNSPLAIALFFTFYTHIFILGLLGNLAIVFLTFRFKQLHSVKNLFILNLAIADIIVCMLSLPFTPVTNIYKEWLFGSAICHLLPMVQAVSIFVSVFSLSAIAIDRYWLVHFPHSASLSLGQAILVAVVLWVLSLLVSAPYAYNMTLEEYDGYCGKFCTEKWPNTQIRRAYALTVLALQFLLPFITMSFCYASIFYRFRQRTKQKKQRLNERYKLLAMSSSRKCSGIAASTIGGANFDDSTAVNGVNVSSSGINERPATNGGDERRSAAHCCDEESGRGRVNALNKRQRRTTSILATIVLFFGLAWLPHNMVTLAIEYDEHLLRWGTVNYTYLLSMVSHSLAMTTNVANPILYAWLNPTFKELFLRTLNPLLFGRKTAGRRQSRRLQLAVHHQWHIRSRKKEADKFQTTRRLNEGNGNTTTTGGGGKEQTTLLVITD